jgi:hypothetical protein
MFHNFCIRGGSLLVMGAVFLFGGGWGFTWVSLDAVGGSLYGRVILGAY